MLFAESESGVFDPRSNLKGILLVRNMLHFLEHARQCRVIRRHPCSNDEGTDGIGSIHDDGHGDRSTRVNALGMDWWIFCFSSLSCRCEFLGARSCPHDRCFALTPFILLSSEKINGGLDGIRTIRGDPRVESIALQGSFNEMEKSFCQVTLSLDSGKSMAKGLSQQIREMQKTVLLSGSRGIQGPGTWRGSGHTLSSTLNRNHVSEAS